MEKRNVNQTAATKVAENKGATVAQTSKRAQEIIAKANAKKAEAKAESKPKADKKAPAPKKEKKVTLASLLDVLILKGGQWPVLIDEANAASKSLGCTTKYSIGALKAHIKFRTDRNPKYLGNLKVAEAGIVAAGKSK